MFIIIFHKLKCAIHYALRSMLHL